MGTPPPSMQTAKHIWPSVVYLKVVHIIMKLANGTGTARTEPGANRTAEPDTATRTARTGTART